MDHAIYTALGAANASLNRQAITANNLANVSTSGFRAQVAAFRAMSVEGESIPTRTLVTASTPYNDYSVGAINTTGRPLDVALPQNGWLAVQMSDGREAYTRNGNIETDGEGALTVRGLPVIGDNGPIRVPPQAQLTIAADGTVTALGVGDEPAALAQVAKIKMVNAGPYSLQNGDDGLFHVTASTAAARGETLPADPEMKLTPAALESSNVSPVKAMVEMIANARGFDMNMKVISAVDDNEKKSNQLLNLG